MENNENSTYQLTIYDFIRVSADFLKDPLKEENQSALEEIKQKMVVREYLPLRQKEIVLQKALKDTIIMDGSATHFVSSKEIAMFFDCLMAYVINLDPDFSNLVKDYEVYDLLYLAGIPQRILDFCAEDYMKLTDMMRDTISFDNIEKLMSELDAASDENVQTLTRAFENYTRNLKPETEKFLAAITTANDPLLNTIKEGIVESALHATKNDDTEPEGTN